MNGNGGNDVFIGNTGADIMNGSIAGNDTFVFKATTDSHSGAGNFDTISTFTHGSDHLDFTAIANATHYQGNITGGSVDANSIGWLVDNANNQTIVYVNTGAAAVPVANAAMEIHITGTNINLSEADILHHS